MIYLLSDELAFPPPQNAEPSGLLAVGGDLRPERLALAYSLGIFPWYNHDETPPLWHAPHERMVLFPDRLMVNRSLRRALNKGRFQLTYDAAFERVLSCCAGVHRPDQDGTWLHEELQQSLTALHHQGLAHSAEAWLDGELVGGLYGVTIGRVFFGESMFALAPDASKVAFVTLVRRLSALGYALIDCQAYTEHLARFGAREMQGKRFHSLINTLTRERPREVWPSA